MTARFLVTRASAYIPVAMSLAALAVVAWALSTGAVREPDEGTAAHVWQLLTAGQVPIVAYFAFKWVPQAPRQGMLILAVQLIAALGALAPVYLLRL